MKNLKLRCAICATLCLIFLPIAALAIPPDEVVVGVADRLVAAQNSAGTWLGEEDFTGSIVAGLVRAYEVTDNDAYINTAESGANYTLDVAGGNYFGDEAYALVRLSEAIGEPTFADAVLEFYNVLDTAEYISGFDATDRSNAVFYIAHHAVAAYMVGAPDAEIWRQSLIRYLSRIDDDLAFYPVMSLGVATWALAQTGPMDDTKVDPNVPSSIGEEIWADVSLSDLPDMLSTHQVLSGDYEGSFTVRFDHASPGEGYEAGGYTEDTIYGLLGLVAADGLITADGIELDFDAEIQNARDVLAISVSPSGFVQNHIWLRSPVYHTFGGELLQTAALEPIPVLSLRGIQMQKSPPRRAFRPPMISR